jgi:2-polyprenyl-3-methyl-5-hydroxy-6-metoxy-1,4-benzoquinol methylase
MEPESMVHALEKIHSLLKPGGHLIDIHPNGELVEFIYPLDGQEHFIGYMQETDDYIEYRQADEALEAMVAKGLFRVEKTGEFEFRTYADSFDELKSFLDENWSDAVITEAVIASARNLEEEYGVRKVFLCEGTKIGLLRRV